MADAKNEKRVGNKYRKPRNTAEMLDWKPEGDVSVRSSAVSFDGGGRLRVADCKLCIWSVGTAGCCGASEGTSAIMAD
jgi:hypothetical protein